MRSSALLPRNRVGACSPSTQRIASTTFDLPQPLGPTTAVAPALKLITVASRKDLKPTNSRLLRRIQASPPPPHHLIEHIPSAPKRVNIYASEFGSIAFLLFFANTTPSSFELSKRAAMRETQSGEPPNP